MQRLIFFKKIFICFHFWKKIRCTYIYKYMSIFFKMLQNDIRDSLIIKYLEYSQIISNSWFIQICHIQKYLIYIIKELFITNFITFNGTKIIYIKSHFKQYFLIIFWKNHYIYIYRNILRTRKFIIIYI